MLPEMQVWTKMTGESLKAGLPAMDHRQNDHSRMAKNRMLNFIDKRFKSEPQNLLGLSPSPVRIKIT